MQVGLVIDDVTHARRHRPIVIGKVQNRRAGIRIEIDVACGRVSLVPDVGKSV